MLGSGFWVMCPPWLRLCQKKEHTEDAAKDFNFIIKSTITKKL